MKSLISILILILIITIIFIFIIYDYLIYNKKGKVVPLIENKYLTQISDRLKNHHKFDRCFNPTLFYYRSQIYYVYRISKGDYISHPLNLNRLFYEFSKAKPSENVIYDYINDKCIFIDTKKSKYDKIVGFEDPRAIVYQNMLYLIVNEENKITAKRQMYLISIDLRKLINDTIIPDNIILINYQESVNQKNWMPLIYKKELYLIHSLSPLIILHLNIKTGECIKYVDTIIRNVPKNLRGSSNIIKFKSIDYGTVFLGITHCRYKQVYTHRFFISEYNTNLKPIAISDEFIIQDNHLLFINDNTLKFIKFTGWIQLGIQFVAGLLQIDDILYITYGEHDYYAKQFKINTKVMEDSLIII
jgi:hypothetical protein